MVPDCTCQLALFHRNRAVRTYLNDPELQKLVLKPLRERKPKKAIAVAETSIESALDPAEQETRRRLFSYFSSHANDFVTHTSVFHSLLFFHNSGMMYISTTIIKEVSQYVHESLLSQN